MPLRRFQKAVLASCVLVLAASAASAVRAQDGPTIKWRTDYAAARDESEKKNLPLIIYFTRPLCVWCDKLEASTYRDPRILLALSEKVVPLKINGADQPTLAEKLAVTAFPTIILARPDGQYETMKGYQEADVLHDKIVRVLATLKPSEIVSRDFENAQKWEASGEYARAVAALRTILEDNKGKPLQKSAQELLQKIEKRADDRLAHAKTLQAKGDLLEALEEASDVQRMFAGLKSASEAGELAARITQANTQLRSELQLKRVRDLTAQAEEFYKSKDYIPCLDRCEVILRVYGDMPEARKAYSLRAEIMNNRQWLQAAADVTADRLGVMWLGLADSCLKSGEVKQAEFHLRRVIIVFPGSRMAESAQIRLTQLQATMPAGTDVGATRP